MDSTKPPGSDPRGLRQDSAAAKRIAAVRIASRELGRRLATARRAAGYTQHQLAAAADIPRSVIASSESASNLMARERWQRCGEALGIGDALAVEHDAIISLKMPAHGSRSRYVSGCRCDSCRAVNAAAMRQFRKGPHDPARIPHGSQGYTNYDCRCEVCTRASTLYNAPYSEAWAKRNPDKINAGRRAVQARTLAQARRWGYMWTGPELELAARSDLSATQVALMIGRTYAAVSIMRRRLREEDPRTIWLAGLGDAADVPPEPERP